MIQAPHSKKSLVVGASGQVGSAIVSLLGPAYSIGTSSRKSALGKIWLDLAEVAKHPSDTMCLLRGLGVQAIYCVGGMTDAEGCEFNPELAMRINCEGPAVLASIAAADGLPFLYFSSEYVFNGKAGPYTEESQPDPISAYGRSKFLGEIEVSKAHPKALIVRTTVVYGPDPGAKNFVYSLRRAILAKRIFRVPDDQISTPTYNHDLASAAVALLQSGVYGVVHVAGPERLSRLEFAHRVAKAMKLDAVGIVGVPTAQLGQQAPRPLQAGLLTDKLHQLLPVLPMHTVEESIHHWATATVGGFEDLP
jgi:dTDP-4-dehydrorhamnose reductase